MPSPHPRRKERPVEDDSMSDESEHGSDKQTKPVKGKSKKDMKEKSKNLDSGASGASEDDEVMSQASSVASPRKRVKRGRGKGRSVSRGRNKSRSRSRSTTRKIPAKSSRKGAKKEKEMKKSSVESSHSENDDEEYTEEDHVKPLKSKGRDKERLRGRKPTKGKGKMIKGREERVRKKRSENDDENEKKNEKNLKHESDE